MKKVLATLASLLCIVFCARALADTSASQADQKFLSDAAARYRGDLALGELAIHRGVDPSVKLLGRQTVDDYTTLAAELKRLAQKKGVTLPTDMTAADRDTYARLAKLPGERFDRDFLQLMATRHSVEIDDFEAEAGIGDDADVRNWALQKVAVLRSHRDLAKDDRQHL